VDLDARLRKREWYPGALLPSEEQLAKRYAVSRITIRHALSLLELQGKLTRHQGRATQVSEKLLRHLVPLVPFDVDMRSQGIAFRKELRRFQSVAVDPEIRESLQLGRNQPAVHVREVRYINETPYSMAERYLHPRVASTLKPEDIIERSVYQLLRGKTGRWLFDVTMDVRSCQPEFARVLAIKSGSLVFVYHSVGQFRNGQVPFEIMDAYYPLDRWRFVLKARSGEPRVLRGHPKMLLPTR
jgi:GntR family transcriptional regulator